MARVTPEYQVLVMDLKSQELVGEVPWASISVKEAQNDVTSATFSLPLLDTPPIFGSGRSAFIILRGGTPIGKFLVRGVTPAYPDGISVSAIGTLGYLDLRYNRETLKYQNIDQYQIVRNLVARMQLTSNGNLGIEVSSGSAGVSRTRKYPEVEQLTYLTMIQEIADSDDGFDWRETIADDYTVTMELSSIGFTDTDVVFDLQKNIRRLSVPESADQLVNQFTSFSKSADGLSPVFVSRSNANSLGIYPQYDNSELTDLTPEPANRPLLATRAQLAVDTYSQPVKNVSLEVEPDIDSDFSRYGIGDIVRITASYGYIQLTNAPALVQERAFSISGSGKESVTVGATLI